MGSFRIPKKSVLLEAKEYLMITIGLVIYSFGWSFFLLPFKLVSGGTAGIGAIIQYSTGFPMQYTYFIINIILAFVLFKYSHSLIWSCFANSFFAYVENSVSYGGSKKIRPNLSRQVCRYCK